MAITFTSGLEPIRYDSRSFGSVKESEKRAAEFLQGTAGVVNPLETQVIFSTGVSALTITNAGSGYLSSPLVTFVNSGSFGGSGATVTANLTSGTVTSFTNLTGGAGYTVAPKVVLTGNNTLFNFTDDDIAFDTNIITKTAHGMSNGDRIHLTTDNVLPVGLYSTDVYGNIYANPDFYVISATTDTFQLSKTSGGSAVDINTRDAIGTAFMATGVPAGYPTSNMVVAIQVSGGDNYRGRRYASTPTVTISAPPEGGTQATATCILTDGRVDRVTVTTMGLGYTSVPTVTFSGGHGTHTARQGGGAAVTAITGSGAIAVPVTNATGVITSISVTAGGSNYLAGTVVSITGGGGTGATATAVVSGGAIGSVSVTNGGTTYASLTSLVNYIIPFQTVLNTEIAQATTDTTQIDAWITETPPMVSIPNWTNAGYTVGDLNSVKTAINSYKTILTTCKSAVDSILTSINTSTGTFRQHNERWCGLQGIGINPFVPDLGVLQATVHRIEKLKDELGVPFENYTVKIFGTLFTADDTIDTAINSVVTYGPLWSGTPIDLAAYGVQTIISAGATTPAAIEIVIGGLGGGVAGFGTLVTSLSATFTAHKTNDTAQYNAAEAFMNQVQDGRKHNGWWVDPYTKFMYTDVLGSETTKEIIADIDNGTIT